MGTNTNNTQDVNGEVDVFTQFRQWSKFVGIYFGELVVLWLVVKIKPKRFCVTQWFY